MEERRRLERGLRDSVGRGARDEAEEKVMIMMIVMMVFSDLNLVLYNPSVGEGDIENKSVVWVRGEYCMPHRPQAWRSLRLLISRFILVETG